MGWGRLPRATNSTAAPLVSLHLQPSSAAQHVRRWSGGVLSSAAEVRVGQGSTTGRARSWVVACGVNIARGVVGVTAFASTPRSPSSLVVRDGFVCTPDGKHAYLDQTKPVVVRRPTLWQRARYVVAKVMAAVLSAIGALYPASWLFFVQYKEVDIFTDSWDWLNATPALIAGPLVLFVAAAYMWYRGCGTYFTVPELATFRDRALLSEYSEIVDEHGLGQATKFVTPRELRIKLFKQARDKGILSCLKDASVVEWMNTGMLLPDEAQPVSQIQRSLQDAHRRLKIETSALEQELAELTGKAATKRNRLIADAELSYAACAEAKLVELYSRNYRDRIASARKERDNKIARLNNTANVSPTQRNAEKAEIERECDRIEEVEARLYQEQMRSNLPNLEKRARERDDAILSAREEFETHTQAVRIEKQIDLRLKRSQDTFAQQVAKLQREWDNLADSTLEKNTARTPDSVPFVVPLVPFVAPL